MDQDIRVFGTELGRQALARNWAAVHALLAPWLRTRTSPDDIRRFFEDEYRVTLEENGVTGMFYPEHSEPQLGGNSFMSASDLRTPISFANGKVRPLAPEVTDANVRYWMKMQLLCSPQQQERLAFDFFCEVWMAVVTTPEGLRVGYWSQGAY